ncbi:hypothetical protein ACVNNN_09200 [Lysinibacillus fusiformis]|uniref:hypothetical protein n=1 Tax=Lysinibacillus sp. PWR01 TaxID=3342384 RepID=UPI00372D5ABD
MQQRIIHCLFTFLFFFILIIPTASASATVIGERNAMGFHYVVLQENDHFKWDIAHKDSQKVIVESQDNAGLLAQYREAVNELHSTLIVSLIILIIVLIAVIICWLFFRKQKHELKNPAAIVFVLPFALAIMIIFKQSLHLNQTIQQATYIFHHISG